MATATEGHSRMAHAQQRAQSASWRTERTPSNAAERMLSVHARTSFHFAARFLPPVKRKCATDLYAFFRTLDDLVDESTDDVPRQAVRVELDAWRVWLAGSRDGSAPREPLGADLAHVISQCAVPVELFQHMLDGLEADLQPRELADEAELQTYCYQVASTVGHAMAHVLGATSPAALAAAGNLGAAMQRTNILRDVGEDLLAGRVYLPTTTLARFDLGHAELRHMQMQSGSGPDERFRALMRHEIAHTRALYAEALPGIWLLPADCRMPILVAGRLYRSLLDRIEANDYDSLRYRAATTKFQKMREAAVCAALTWRHRREVAPATQESARPFSAIEVQAD